MSSFDLPDQPTVKALQETGHRSALHLSMVLSFKNKVSCRNNIPAHMFFDWETPEDSTVADRDRKETACSRAASKCIVKLKQTSPRQDRQAASPSTPALVTKTKSKCSRLDKKNSNKHHTPQGSFSMERFISSNWNKADN